jgi:hypothetical protein
VTHAPVPIYALALAITRLVVIMFCMQKAQALPSIINREKEGVS